MRAPGEFGPLRDEAGRQLRVEVVEHVGRQWWRCREVRRHSGLDLRIAVGDQPLFVGGAPSALRGQVVA
jgi:hypothetical protein